MSKTSKILSEPLFRQPVWRQKTRVPKPNNLNPAIRFEFLGHRSVRFQPACAAHSLVPRRDGESIKLLKPCKSFLKNFWVILFTIHSQPKTSKSPLFIRLFQAPVNQIVLIQPQRRSQLTQKMVETSSLKAVLSLSTISRMSSRNKMTCGGMNILASSAHSGPVNKSIISGSILSSYDSFAVGQIPVEV